MGACLVERGGVDGGGVRAVAAAGEASEDPGQDDHDRLDVLFEDEEFAALYPADGRPGCHRGSRRWYRCCSSRRISLVGEALRAALEALAEAAPDRLPALIAPEWGKRFGRKVEIGKLPGGKRRRPSGLSRPARTGRRFSPLPGPHLPRRTCGCCRRWRSLLADGEAEQVTQRALVALAHHGAPPPRVGSDGAPGRRTALPVPGTGAPTGNEVAGAAHRFLGGPRLRRPSGRRSATRSPWPPWGRSSPKAT